MFYIIYIIYTVYHVDIHIHSYTVYHIIYTIIYTYHLHLHHLTSARASPRAGPEEVRLVLRAEVLDRPLRHPGGRPQKGLVAVARRAAGPHELPRAAVTRA